MFHPANPRTHEGWYSRVNFIGGSSSPAPAGNTTSTQTTQPWSGQEPYLTTGYQQAQTLLNSGGPAYYPGTTYSPETSAQATGLQNQINAGSSDTLTGSAANYSNNVLSGGMLNSNPANAALTPIANGSMLNPMNNPDYAAMMQQVQTSVQPGLESQFSGGNRMDSPGAAYGVSSGVTNALANEAGNMYQQNQANQLTAAGQLGTNYNTAAQQQVQNLLVAPQTSQMPMTDASNIYNAGTAQQTLGQNTINANMAQYNYNQALPYNLLDYYNQAIGGSVGSASSLTSPYFTQPSNTGAEVTQGLGDAASIAALASIFA